MSIRATALITGASSGIGSATASQLVKDGLRVFGTTRRSTPPPDAPAGVEWVSLDVCSEDSVRKGVEEVLAQSGRLDALVCNAGFGIFGSVEEVSIEEAQRQLDVNFFGVLRTLRAVLPGMREARSGRIVLVGSLAGRAPIPFQAHYSASKAAVDNLALSLRNEVRGFGIHVSLLEPGDINTPFNDAMTWGDPAKSAYGDKIRTTERVVREQLPKAPGPEVVARAISEILRAKRPPVRRAVGPDSLFVPVGKRLLPDWLNLALIRQHFDL